MKKLVILLVMMLVASGVNAQSTVENLFERLENKEKEEIAEQEALVMREELKRKEKSERKLCRDFANKLRFDGVDITKLTDKDIDQLDSLRRERIMQDKYNSLYSLPSAIFKDEMKKERHYYARIIKTGPSYSKHKVKNDTIYCDADSTVFVTPGYYEFLIKDSWPPIYGSRRIRVREYTIFEDYNYLFTGKEIKIGRATFICRESEEKTKEENIKKTKKRKHYDDVYE